MPQFCPQGEPRHKHHEKFMASQQQIWNEISRQETQPTHQTPVGVIEQALQELAAEEDPTAAVDILEYIQAKWGLDETPYPIQKALLKLIFGLELDTETRDIEIWDQFRENLVAKLTEAEFLEYLYKDKRCNISLEEHQKRVGKRHTTIIFRLGRRGTKTTMSQWITAYEIYRLLKLRCPQQYYKLRQDQPIRCVLVATGKEQAQDLLAPARAAIQRSPYLRRYVEQDSTQSIKLATARTRETGVGATSGLSVQASPCSARGLRGPANILALLEEYGSFFWELKGSNKSDVSIYRALQPSISDFKDPITGDPVGMMMIISTPLSRESHMHKLEENIWKENINGLVIHIPSWWMNPLLTTERLRELHASDRLGFDQEYGAEYLDNVESAFSEDEMRAILEPINADARRVRPGESTYMGIDLGLKNDGTTISIVTVDAEGKCRLVHHEQWRTKMVGKYEDYDRIPIEEMADRVDKMWEYWSCKGGIYDQWNAYGLDSHLKSGARRGLVHVEFNQTGNDRLARHMISTIQQERLTIYGEQTDWDDSDSVVREFVRLQRQQTSGDPPKIKIQAPNIQGFHDDQYSSISRAVWSAKLGVKGHPQTEVGGRERQQKTAAHARKVQMETIRRQRTRTDRNPGGGAGIGRR